MLDASGIIHVREDLYLVAEDELDVLRFFQLDLENGSFNATGDVIDFGQEESDFESLAYDPVRQRFYCIGSHGYSYSKRLVAFQLDRDSNVSSFEIDFDAKQFFDDDVDVEALSVWNSRLFIGYRRPTRKDTAIVVIFDVDCGSQVLTCFDLGGRSFRDIVRIDDDNYLILAGPERGKHYRKLPPRVFWWNGDIHCPKLAQCDIDLGGFRAEGIAAKVHHDTSIEILIGSDESKIKEAGEFRMRYYRAGNLSAITDSHLKTVELSVSL
jgi:hypothetical protein